MKASNTTLLIASSILAAALSTSAIAADKAERPSATDSKAAAADATSEKARAEFIRARNAGELDYGHEFQIAETTAFKHSKPEAVKLAAH